MKDTWEIILLFLAVIDEETSVLNLLQSDDFDTKHDELIQTVENIETDKAEAESEGYGMTSRELIEAILECYFTGFKEEIIDSACNRILDQEPCEDCISRKEVIQIINDFSYKNEHEETLINERIKNLPSIQPKAKTGHWIISPNDCFVSCSECGLHGDKGIYKHYRWCPNCGAKMESEETE